MRRIVFLCVAVAMSALAFSGAQAAGINCAVVYPTDGKATLWLHHHKIASCGNAAGCKFVACYDLERLGLRPGHPARSAG